MGIADNMFTGDVWRAIQDLRQQLQNLTSGRRLEDASVGARGIRLIANEDGEGGTLTVDGGVFQSLTPDGVEIIFTGPLNGSRVWKLAYDDGPTAVGTLGSAGNQFVAWWDHNDNIVFSTDAVTSTGLARPYLNIPMVPSTGTSVGTGGPFWPEFVNSSFQEVMYRITTLWHPRIKIGVNTNTTSGDVQWELRIDGVTAGSGTNDGSGTFAIPGWGDTILPGNQKSVQLWARNTLGTASRLIVDTCYGTQS